MTGNTPTWFAELLRTGLKGLQHGRPADEVEDTRQLHLSRTAHGRLAEAA